ncbi:MAG: hypothetical protein B6I26_08570, partial [Desulfobacteraceae bacterium 4572_130]
MNLNINFNHLDFSDSLKEISQSIDGSKSNFLNTTNIQNNSKIMFVKILNQLLGAQQIQKTNQNIPINIKNTPINHSTSNDTTSIKLINSKAVINSKDLQAFNQFFVDIGFSKNKVNNLTANLLAEANNGDILFSDLIDGILKLTPFNNKGEKIADFMMQLFPQPKNNIPEKKILEHETQKDNILAISALPFIDSIMTSLKIPENISKNIISEAKEEGIGIDLDIFIKELQKLQKKSFLSGTNFRTSPGADKNNLNIMLQQIGLKATNPQKETFTLDEFVLSLEHIRQKNKIDLPMKNFNPEKNFSSKKDIDKVEILFLMKDLIKTLKTEQGNKETINSLEQAINTQANKKTINSLEQAINTQANKKTI